MLLWVQFPVLAVLLHLEVVLPPGPVLVVAQPRGCDTFAGGGYVSCVTIERRCCSRRRFEAARQAGMLANASARHHTLAHVIRPPAWPLTTSQRRPTTFLEQCP